MNIYRKDFAFYCIFGERAELPLKKFGNWLRNHNLYDKLEEKQEKEAVSYGDSCEK